MAILVLNLVDEDKKSLSQVSVDAELVLMARSTVIPPDEDLGRRPDVPGPRVMLARRPLTEVVEQSCGRQQATTGADGTATLVWDTASVEQKLKGLESHRLGPEAAKVTGEFRVIIQVDNVTRTVVITNRITRADESREQTIGHLFAYSCVGHTTATGTTIWCALRDPPVPTANYEVRIYKHDRIARPLPQPTLDRLTTRVSTTPLPMNGRTGTVQISGLNPETAYRYEVVRVGGNASAAERVVARGSFPTSKQQSTQIRIAFGSCKNLVDTTAGARILRQLAEQPRDMLFLIGDQLYGDRARSAFESQSGSLVSGSSRDHRDRSRASFRAYESLYLQSWASPAWRECIRRGPTYMILDDHEIADDWGTTFTGHTNPALVTGGLDAYRVWQHDHNPSTTQNKFHYHFSSGPVSFFFLDVRSRRGRGEDPNHPVLGPTQAADLQSWAAGEASAADVAVVVCPVPLVLGPGAVVQNAIEWTRRKLSQYADFVYDVPILGDIVESGVDIIGDIGPLDDFRVVEPDLADQWTVEPNRRDLGFVLKVLFDLANDVAGGGSRPRTVIVLCGDSHAGAIHEITSKDPRHASQPSIVQLMSSPLTSVPAFGLGSEEFSSVIARSGEWAWGVPSPFSARFLSNPPFLAANNFGMLTITRVDPIRRTYRIEGSIRSSDGSLVFDRVYDLGPAIRFPIGGVVPT